MIEPTIKTIVEGMSTAPMYHYAKRFEANKIAIEEIKAADFASQLFIYAPPVGHTDNYPASPTLNTVFELVFSVLMRKDAKQDPETIDYKSAAVQDMIDTSRTVAREFIYLLNKNAIITPNRKIEVVRYQNEYNSFSAGLFGVTGRCDVPITEGITGCAD